MRIERLVGILIKRGAKVDKRDADGNTSLYYAIANQRYSTVRTLFAHHANPRIQNHKGETAFDTASNSNDEIVLNLLKARSR